LRYTNASLGFFPFSAIIKGLRQTGFRPCRTPLIGFLNLSAELTSQMIRRLIPSCKHSRGQGLQSLTLQWSANRFWLPCFFAVTISIRISSWTHLRIPPLNRQTYICCDYNLPKPLAASSRFPFWDLASHGAFVPWCRADRILSDFTPSKTKHNSLDLLSFGVSGFCRPVLTHFLFQGFYPLRVYSAYAAVPRINEAVPLWSSYLLP